MISTPHQAAGGKPDAGIGCRTRNFLGVSEVSKEQQSDVFILEACGLIRVAEWEDEKYGPCYKASSLDHDQVTNKSWVN